MRYYMIGLLLLSGAAVPALAQTNDQVERRIEKLERDLQNMQRRTSGNIVVPEIQPAGAGETAGLPATSAIADLIARIDALEGQLARITGATEENSHRLRQLEEALNQYRGKTDVRLKEIEQGGEPAAAPAAPPAQSSNRAQPAPRDAAPTQPAPRDNATASAAPSAAPSAATPVSAAAPASTGDAGEDAYLAGFRQWEAGEMAAAQKSLEAMAKKYPKHRRASYALNLAGRAYLDDGKPATAAKLFLANYQTNPKGERAADSLYFLGQALFKLKKPAEACKVYDELADVYPDMRAWVKERLPQARSAAKCK